MQRANEAPIKIGSSNRIVRATFIQEDDEEVDEEWYLR